MKPEYSVFPNKCQLFGPNNGALISHILRKPSGFRWYGFQCRIFCRKFGQKATRKLSAITHKRVAACERLCPLGEKRRLPHPQLTGTDTGRKSPRSTNARVPRLSSISPSQKSVGSGGMNYHLGKSEQAMMRLLSDWRHAQELIWLYYLMAYAWLLDLPW